MFSIDLRVMRQIMAACVLFSFLALPGCGGGEDDGPPRASVSGRVTIDGKPVEGVEVHFINPDYPNNGSFGLTDSEGNYRLAKGAVVGLNNIFFSKIVGDESILKEEGMDAAQLEAMNAAGTPGGKGQQGPKQLVPEEFTSEKSKLTFEVPAGGTTKANFDL